LPINLYLYFGVRFLFSNSISSLMSYDVIKFPDNFTIQDYTNFGYLEYLCNCGLALRVVPNGTVSLSLNYMGE